MIKYSVGDKVHIFLTWGALSENANLQAKDIFKRKSRRVL